MHEELGPRSPSRACPQTLSRVLPFGPRLRSLPRVLTSVCTAPLGPGLDSGAACPVPESALCGACHASGLFCARLTAGCCCPLGSGCRLVAHTEAWPPMVWPLPGGDPDLVQEGPPPGAEEGLYLLQ